MVTENALLPVVKLDAFPNSVVDVFIEFPQTDAGSRCAGITAASIALADAGLTMRDLVTSVSVGVVGDMVLVDLDYSEEAYEDGEVADVPIAMVLSTGEITLLQMDGKISRKQLNSALELARKALQPIYKAQQDALKARYVVGEKNE